MVEQVTDTALSNNDYCVLVFVDSKTGTLIGKQHISRKLLSIFNPYSIFDSTNALTYHEVRWCKNTFIESTQMIYT